jgi:hypothetical protein
MKEDFFKFSEENDKTGKKLLEKLESKNIELDYSNLLVSAMGHWLSIGALSTIEEIFEDGIISPSKISDDIGDALDFMFKEAKYLKHSKKYTISQESSKSVPSQDLLSLIEELQNKGCRFFKNLLFSDFEEPVELTPADVVTTLCQEETLKGLDVVTQDGYGHSVFEPEDLKSIHKYGLSKTEKEFLEDDVLSKLKAEDIIIEGQSQDRVMSDVTLSIGDYLDSGGILLLKKPDGKYEKIEKREQLWEVEPALMAINKENFLGQPAYPDLIKKEI